MDNNYSVTNQQGVVLVKTRLNLRDQPSTDSNLIGTLLPSSKVNFNAVISDGQSVNGNSVWYKDFNEHFFWSGGVDVQLIKTQTSANQILIPSGIDFTGLDLPVNKTQCLKAAEWLQQSFGNIIADSLSQTSFTPSLLYAIACQETAIYWIQWINDHEPNEILGRCVFDASGDANGNRSVFPKNTADFVARYGQDKADILIAEANLTRTWRGWGPKPWVYAGYGLFQYDIQYVQNDPDFFFDKKWYNIDDCVSKVIEELSSKQKTFPNDLFNTVRAYNGSGVRAVNYARNVFQFLDWIQNDNI